MTHQIMAHQIMTHHLWDMAGVDGLAMAKSLFGEAIGHLAPFQSLETTIQHENCSVLRLCDYNFRIAYAGAFDRLIAQQLGPQYCIWIKQYDWLGRMQITLDRLPALIEQASVRAPHRLANLPNNQAVPAQLDDIALVIWRHYIQGQPAVEIHASQSHLTCLKTKINQP
ncbi:MAG: hypothetical protein HLUCCA11_05480 [Phormidesmis priestleyi Ana]|uniref:Uncharacterized protein n=1 Tax=Phormidesmis priestleyi Ana TaxID=1666911 RepID=A0A0N8KNI3_9CYAN|nr:MAG: hypothetical protein HLUCCA11_05480 [Phormidesmis priestleyi Ana]